MPGRGFEAPPMTAVKSSNLKAVGYDADRQELYVEFLAKDAQGHANQNKPGDLYRYYGVPKNVYNRLMNAASKGEFVWKHIRGKYRYMMKGRTGWRGPSRRTESSGARAVSAKRKAIDAKRSRSRR